MSYWNNKPILFDFNPIGDIAFVDVHDPVP